MAPKRPSIEPADRRLAGVKLALSSGCRTAAVWRYSTRGGFYQPPGVLLVPSSANTDRFLGEQYNLHAEWQATAHINVNAVYVHFTPAGFLKSAGAKGIDYVGIWTAYIF